MASGAGAGIRPLGFPRISSGDHSALRTPRGSKPFVSGTPLSQAPSFQRPMRWSLLLAGFGALKICSDSLVSCSEAKITSINRPLSTDGYPSDRRIPAPVKKQRWGLDQPVSRLSRCDEATCHGSGASGSVLTLPVGGVSAWLFGPSTGASIKTPCETGLDRSAGTVRPQVLGIRANGAQQSVDRDRGHQARRIVCPAQVWNDANISGTRAANLAAAVFIRCWCPGSSSPGGGPSDHRTVRRSRYRPTTPLPTAPSAHWHVERPARIVANDGLGDPLQPSQSAPAPRSPEANATPRSWNDPLIPDNRRRARLSLPGQFFRLPLGTQSRESPPTLSVGRHRSPRPVRVSSA